MKGLMLKIKKHIHKDTIVKVIIAYPDKRVRTHWVIPTGDVVTIKSMSFNINPKDVVYSEGFPTFIYHVGSSEPLNLFSQKTFMTADDFNVAISAKVVRDMMDATSDKKETFNLSTILSGLSLILSVVVIYFVLTNFTTISNQLNELKEVLRIIGGIYD